MFGYCDNGINVLVYGSDDVNFQDSDQLFYGVITKLKMPDSEDSKHYYFEPFSGLVFTCEMLAEIAEKVSELNMSDTAG